MILQGNSFPDNIDIYTEKVAMVQQLRTIDCSNGFNQEEVLAINGLDSILDEEARIDLEHRLSSISIDEEARIDLEHRLSSISIDDLERRLVTAKRIRQQAQLEDDIATIKLTRLHGKMEARKELRQEIENSLACIKQALAQHVSKVARASSDVFNRGFLSTPDGPNEMHLKRDQTSDHSGIRTGAHWMADSLQRTTDELDTEIAAATATLDATQAAISKA
ncbi:hypothetical protein ACHAQD_011915 [Fusarium lateritium]